MTGIHVQQNATLTLPSPTQIQIVRSFQAPRHLVYQAWTTPELVRRWWAADHGEMTVAEIDLQVDGKWRYAMVTHQGQEVAFHGVFHEIVPDERIVSTEVYEAMPEEEALNTATFTDTPKGGTLLTLLIEHPNQHTRDLHLNSGMESGLQKALNLLEQVALSEQS